MAFGRFRLVQRCRTPRIVRAHRAVLSNVKEREMWRRSPSAGLFTLSSIAPGCHCSGQPKNVCEWSSAVVEVGAARYHSWTRLPSALIEGPAVGRVASPAAAPQIRHSRTRGVRRGPGDRPKTADSRLITDTALIPRPPRSPSGANFRIADKPGVEGNRLSAEA